MPDRAEKSYLEIVEVSQLPENASDEEILNWSMQNIKIDQPQNSNSQFLTIIQEIKKLIIRSFKATEAYRAYSKTMKQAEIAMNYGQTEKAIELFHEALLFDYPNCRSSYHLGLLYYQQKDWSTALRMFQKMPSIRNQEYFLEYIITLKNLKKYQFAYAALKKYLKSNPTNQDALILKEILEQFLKSDL